MNRPLSFQWDGLCAARHRLAGRTEVTAMQLAAGSVHEFIEVGILPDIHVIEEATEFFIKGNTSTAILILLVALPVLAMLPNHWLRFGAGRVSQ